MKRRIVMQGITCFLLCLIVGGCNSSGSIELRPFTAMQQSNVSGIAASTSSNLINGGVAAAGRDELYYVSTYDEAGIYARDYAGQHRRVLAEDKAAYLNLEDDWLYYQNLSDKGRIYRVHVQSGERERIGDEYATSLVVSDGRIFYLNQDDAGISSRNVDGSGYVKLWSGGASFLNVWDGRLYFATQDSIMSLNVDGTGEATVLPGGGGSSMAVSNGKIYWIDARFELRVINADGTGARTLAQSAGPTFVLDDHYVYFRQSEHLVRIPIKGGAIEPFVQIAAFEHPQLIGSTVIFSEHPDLSKTKLWMLPIGEKQATELE